MFHFIICGFFLSLSAFCASADEILGCGGFIKSEVQLDFSRVQIKLFTKQGSLKDHTDCAPHNGYYFLPLYDKGEYVLKLVPPTGWSFDKTEIVLNVDGKTDLCSKGKDINFHFKGFGITGQVVSVNSDKGPSGVKVSYVEQGKSRETVTSDGGHFQFSPVISGSYSLVASHPKWKFLKNSVTVNVKMANTEIPKDSFVVAGYDVSGRVTTMDNEPIGDVNIVLYNSQLKQMIPECSVETLIGFESIPQLGKPICSIKSNQNGIFQFDSLPPGKYTIVPFYKKNNVQFELQPKIIEFIVEHKSLELDRKYQVTGLTITGRAILPKDNKDGVTIIVNDEQKTMTSSNGEYVLSNIRPGTYKLTATAENVLYEEIDLVLSPTKYSIETLKPRSFKTCGQVISDDVQNVVYQLQGSSNQQFNAQSDPENNGGQYCLYLVPGVYEVQVIPKDGENAENVQFYPISQTVEVTSSAPPPIIFSQLKAIVTGDVQCFEQFECDSLEVELKSMSSGRNMAFKASVSSSGKYKFTDIPPGRYSATIIGNGVCWDQDKYYISINSDEATIQTFKQFGYRVSFRSAYDIQIKYEFLTDTDNVVNEGLIFDKPFRGSNSCCVPKPGRYRFIGEGCHVYEPKHIEWSTPASRSPKTNTLAFNAVSHAHGVQVLSDENIKDIQLRVFNKNIDMILDPKLENQVTNTGVIHNFVLQLQELQSVNIQPLSKTMLFKPKLLQLVANAYCVDIAAKIYAFKGKILSGQVVPSLPGIKITVTHMDQVIVQYETTDDGKFHFGPFDGSKEYKITAEKENYYIEGPDKNGNLIAHKMADILVEAVDQDQVPLTGVLVSVSGGDNYRKNLQTTQNGQIQFTSLNPGEYFMRPMMKEYRFDPNSKMLTVKEGESYKVKVVGKRIAFSAFGHVQSLSGLGETDALVIATSTSKDKDCVDHIEEATTDTNGAFRIRGLLPSCSYDLQIKQNDAHVVHVNNIKNDVNGIQLICLQPPAYTDVTVHVYTPKPEDYRSLRVKLGYGDQVANPIQSVRLDPQIVTSSRKAPIPEPGVLVVLNSVPFDHKQYYVQLDTSISSSHQSYDSSPVYFYSNTSFKHIYLRFEPKSKQPEYDLNNQPSLLVLPFIVLIGLVIYNIDKVKVVVQGQIPIVLQHIQSLTNTVQQQTQQQSSNTKEHYSHNDYAEIEQIVQNINATKQKPGKKRAMLVN